MRMHAKLSAREERLSMLFKEVGSNARTWAGDVGNTYLKKPIAAGNAPRAVAGVAMAGLSTVLEAPDYLIAGALDNKLEAPPAVPMGRTRRDAGQLLKNIVTLHPLRAATDAVRLVTTDVLLDVPEAVIGFERNGTRTQAAHALAA